jgi:hypothetical protein
MLSPPTSCGAALLQAGTRMRAGPPLELPMKAAAPAAAVVLLRLQLPMMTARLRALTQTSLTATSLGPTEGAAAVAVAALGYT